MGNFFHLQRLLKPLEDVWSLLFPQTTTASSSITWETQHIPSPRLVQGRWRRILIQTWVDCDKLQPSASLLLALQAARGSLSQGSAHARLCCPAQLAQVWLTRVPPGQCWCVGQLPLAHKISICARSDAASDCLVPLSPQKHLWLLEGVTLGQETTILRKGFPPHSLLFPGIGISSIRWCWKPSPYSNYQCSG